MIAWTKQTSTTFCKSEADSQFPEIERALNPKDLENGKRRVFEKLEFYSKATTRVATTLLADTVLEAQRQEILEWIWPKSKSYIPPKTGKLVDQACRGFLTSSEYAAWVGNGSSTLICTGQRTSSNFVITDLCEAGAGKSFLRLIPASFLLG